MPVENDSTPRGDKHIMDATELQAKATIAAALIIAHAVEVPTLPTASKRASGKDDALSGCVSWSTTCTKRWLETVLDRDLWTPW